MATTTTTTTTTTASPATPMLASINAASHVHLLVGINPLTSTRAAQSLAAGAHPILIAPPPPPPPASSSPTSPPPASSSSSSSSSSPTSPLPASSSSSSSSSSSANASTLLPALDDKIAAGLVTWHQVPFRESHLLTLGRHQVGHVVDAVFVTLPPAPRRPRLQPGEEAEQQRHQADKAPRQPDQPPSAEQTSALCQRHRIPVNVVDAPHLCTFSLLSVHTDGPLQIGVTTNGRGCKLAARIRREIAGLLPPGLGSACERLGGLRRRIQQRGADDAAAAAAAANPPPAGDATTAAAAAVAAVAVGDLDDSTGQGSSFNGLVREGADQDQDQDQDQDHDAARNRRMRWLAQMCEYWPLGRLASVTDDDIEKLLSTCPATADTSSPPSAAPAGARPRTPPGKVILAGSGPGHPSLLTTATLQAIQTADVILADKLVPAPVLALIPRRTPTTIARKFPGNADRAQAELLDAALAALQAGKTVLRLKQGDPYLYGRGGEEVAFFHARGLHDRVVVLPGLTSALSAPLFAGIPATQRDVADQVLVCTGTGKKGVAPAPPPYVPTQTVVFLMALHRIGGLVGELTRDANTNTTADPTTTTTGQTPGSSHTESPSSATTQPPPPRSLFPLATPCAVIERASCPDQRVIRTTLQHVAAAVDAEGSRPPGLLVVGRACQVLLETEHAPGPHPLWVVQEGFRGLDGLGGGEPGWAAGLQPVTGGA